jgi:hypothetical protein
MCAPRVVLIERVNATLTKWLGTTRPTRTGPVHGIQFITRSHLLVFSGHVARQGIPASATRTQNPFLTDRQYI